MSETHRGERGRESGDNRGSVSIGECSLMHSSIFLRLSLPVGENSSVCASRKTPDFLKIILQKSCLFPTCQSVCEDGPSFLASFLPALVNHGLVFSVFLLR